MDRVPVAHSCKQALRSAALTDVDIDDLGIGKDGEVDSFPEALNQLIELALRGAPKHMVDRIHSRQLTEAFPDTIPVAFNVVRKQSCRGQGLGKDEYEAAQRVSWSLD